MSHAKVVVVGGSGALGQALCRLLSAQGAHVGFTYCSQSAAARDLALAVPNLHAVHLDVTDCAAVVPALDQLLARLGGLDALVYAAGVGSTQSPPGFDRIHQVSAQGWDRLFSVNVRGAFLVLQHVMGRFNAQGGNVVLVGSVDGVKCVPAPVPYAASKAALTALATAVAKETGKQGIRINVVAPGVLEGGVSTTLPADLRTEYLKHSAQKRFGTMKEAAETLAWFALHNSYITGQTVTLDGGL